ncbi:MAG: metallophosphoesterase [Gammaproteobacteria bacterium]|nr:metallophosphoesterase [Gammaproteobacteria bacterium]
MKKIIFAVMAGLIGFCVSTTLFAASLPNKSIEKFITVADIHFDPFTECPLSVRTCPLIDKLIHTQPVEWPAIFGSEGFTPKVMYYNDTNYSLLTTTLNEIRLLDQKEHFNFILLLGDLLGHELRFKYVLYSHDYTKSGYRKFVNKIQVFLVQQFQKTLPNIDIYPAIGNNDSYTGDYSVVPDGIYLKDTARLWSSLIHNGANRNSFVRDFPYGGYYAVNFPNNLNQRIVILDTVLFIKTSNKKMQIAAHKQLEWFYNQLKLAQQAHQKVLIAFHIPLGFNLYATIKDPSAGIQGFWNEEYSNQFRQYIREFSTNIAAVLSAHIHINALQYAVFDAPQEVYVSSTPSISPIFGNSPGFTVYSYDVNSLQIKGLATYFYAFDHRTGRLNWHE